MNEWILLEKAQGLLYIIFKKKLKAVCNEWELIKSVQSYPKYVIPFLLRGLFAWFLEYFDLASWTE